MALLLNPMTLYISQQYYLVFGDDFYIVPFLIAGDTLSNWSVLVQNSIVSMTDENVDHISTWFNITSVLPQASVSNKESLDASKSSLVTSHSVTFIDPITNDDLDPVSIAISEEGDTSNSKEE